MKTIVVATDGSPVAQQAVDFAAGLAKATGATLHTITVEEPPPGGKGGAIRIFETETAAGSTRIAEAAAARATELGATAQAHIAHGDPAHAIAGASSELGAEMIVVGTRGLGGMAGAIMGSVSHGLIKQASVPVTIVHGNK